MRVSSLGVSPPSNVCMTRRQRRSAMSDENASCSNSEAAELPALRAERIAVEIAAQKNPNNHKQTLTAKQDFLKILEC